MFLYTFAFGNGGREITYRETEIRFVQVVKIGGYGFAGDACTIVLNDVLQAVDGNRMH